MDMNVTPGTNHAWRKGSIIPSSVAFIKWIMMQTNPPSQINLFIGIIGDLESRDDRIRSSLTKLKYWAK